MSGFEADWLTLRAAADAAARNPQLLSRLADWAKAKGRLSILDLGCGTGATQRTLAPLLPCRQHWLLIDNDPALLALCPESGQNSEVATMQLDLATDLELLPSESVELVTCSALLDLVSAEWLHRLVTHFSKAAVYFALTVDGRISLEPSLPEDTQVLELVAAHHGRNKSFGPALGYQAAVGAATLLRDAGREVWLEPADWHLGPEESGLQSALLDGYATAATEQTGKSTAMIRQWRDARRHLGEQQFRIGHLDLLSLTA